MATRKSPARLLGQGFMCTGSDSEQGVTLSCCLYGWIHSEGLMHSDIRYNIVSQPSPRLSTDFLFTPSANFTPTPPLVFSCPDLDVGPPPPTSLFGDSCR